MISPALRRRVIEPLYYKVSGSPRLRYWRELESSQYLPESVLFERQWLRLKEMIDHCWAHNDFYRKRMEEVGLTPQQIQSPEDFRRMPLLSKEEIRQNTPSMISRGYDKASLLQFKTGGSTGKSLEIYLTEDCSERRNACARRHDRWSGWEVGEPIGATWGNPKLPTKIKEKARDALLQPYIYLDTMSVSDASVKSFAEAWAKTKPTLLFGHAHSLYLLALHVRDLGIQAINPKGIIATSMMLIPHERQVIESVFGVKVIDRYGCEEVSLIACECEKHEGMHLNIEHLYIEFLDDEGAPVKTGEPGTIVVTDLMNRAMPFLRYQVEDVGVPTEGKCSCGRGLPLMAHVTGRVADFLVRRDGSRVAGVSLIENTLTKLTGIEQMQIIQETLNHIRIKLVKGRQFDVAHAQELHDYLQDVFSKKTRIEIVPVDKIPADKNGKYRFSICNIH